MTRQSDSIKRTTSTRKGGAGIKTIIMAASLAATIGGWGILAVGQVNDSAVAMQQSPAVAQSGSTTIQNSLPATGQTTLRQTTIPTTQQRAVARTRSSR